MTIRIDEDVYELLKQRAKDERRSITAVASILLANAFQTPAQVEPVMPVVAPGCLPAVIEQRESAVSLEARRMVLGNVPRHLLSNSRVRAGLEEQVQQMMKDECDPRGIVLALQEWANRPDAYPGHLPHIYTELLKERTARPKSRSKVEDKVRGYLELGAQMKAEREMREQR